MIPKKDVKIERIRGKGPGGQNKNKVCSCIRLTHIPSGIVVRIDGRDQGQNLKNAYLELEKRLAQAAASVKAAEKKAKRDAAIKDMVTVRTYDYKKGLVFDHRSGKSAPLKEVMGRGRIDLLRNGPAPKVEDWQ